MDINPGAGWAGLLDDITVYIDYLQVEKEMQVTLHLIEAYYHPCLDRLLKYNIHSNSLCTYAKQSFPLWRHCIDRQNKVIARAADGPYFGMCWVGVSEYIVPIRDREGNSVMFISASGYAADREQAVSRMKRVSEKYDLDARQMLEIFDNKLCRELPPMDAVLTLLNPLSWMLTLLLERISYTSMSDMEVSGDSDYLYSRVLQYIDRNYAGALSLEKLSATMNFSPSYISRLFNRKAGMSLRGYINWRRVQIAKMFLSSTRMSIQEITYAVGFSDANYFSTVFRRLCGMPPRAWRERRSEPAKE